MNVGERISGRYKILGKVGAGGMANVYLAKDLILEREVAVKMMALDFQNDESSYRRFQREALSTTELTHPNIVNIYDVGEGNNPYIAMEYVDGLDIKQYIEENHPIPYKKVIQIMTQILSGIAYAHANGVIHRDIKPHNLLIDHDGHVKITDFGIAVALSQNSITQTNSLLGSVQYISPEQARGNMVTRQSDIYSLGIVLYEMLTGSVPFDGESAVSIALKHFQTPIPSLSEFDSRIPQPLENVVLKATAKEPRDRYTSVDEMRIDLETALAPERRDEPIFMPKDLNEDDTLVLDATVAGVNQTVESQAIPVEPKKEEKELDEKPKKKRKRWWLLLLPLLLLAIGLIFILQRPQQIQIPDELVGMTYEDAVELLAEHSLVLGETFEQSNDEVEEGLVFRTNPDAEATVREGSEVDLYVSLGEEPFEIGDYTGENYEEVRAELTDLGFTVESETSTHESVAEGDIIAQDIESGEEVIISETTLTFTVSTGRPVIELRDFSGYRRPDVDNYVSERGLNLNAVEANSDDIPFGEVISQDPAAGTPVYSGNEITVVFSTGPEEVSDVSFTEEITIPYEEKMAETEENPEDQNGEATEDAQAQEPELLPNEIQIYISDLNRDMNTPAAEFTITEDRRHILEFVVEEGGSASYRVVRDGVEILESTVSPPSTSDSN